MFETQLRALALAACLAMTFWLPGMPVKAHAATSSCTSSEGSVGRLKLSSRVSNSAVLLCGNWAKNLNRTAAKSKSVAVKTNPSSTKTVGRSSGSRKKVLTIKTKSGKSITFRNSVTATPATPQIYQNTNQATVGDPVLFKSVTVTHIRYRLLLGVPTEIKFRPIRRLWHIDGVRYGGSSSISPAFFKPGIHTASLGVTFEVSFRVWLRGGWHHLAKPIEVQSPRAEVFIDTNSGEPRFVWYSCIENPAARGCSP